MMEQRENVEKLLLEIERQEAEWQAREKAEQDAAKAKRIAEGKPARNWFQRMIGLR